MYPRTVLFVDDDPIIRICLADALLDEGFEVVEASNVLEAVAVFGAHNVDCMVTDVDMPGDLDGFDLVRFVRSYNARTRIVVVSGGSVPRDGVLENGETFIAKPYRLNDVIATLGLSGAGIPMLMAV
jgi:DNA-binding response OmpR family regulator